jgi:carboxypeptidase Taq
VAELLAAVEASELVHDAEAPAAVNVREMRRRYDRADRLPRTLVKELARATARCQHQWTVARKKNDFSRLRPSLDKVVHLKRREAECLDKDRPYDALLQEYEPGVRGQDIATLFEALRHDLVPLLGAITEAGRRPNVTILKRSFPIDGQHAFGLEVAKALGFDFERGRLDTAVHPFSIAIGPGDCRITTRFTTDNFCDGLFAILHEVGHGLYEQGLDPAHSGTPMGEAASLGVHESQSRLWENIVGRSRPFWKFFFPRACDAFPQALADVTLDDFFFAVNHVHRSANRVQADEVTYNLHILVRFELERALVSGDLKVADLPAAWNEAYKHYLGIVPQNDLEGCLQDGHWSEGLIGYFPTYTLGNLLGAQLFARACADVRDLDREFARGRFGGLLEWLRDNVHRHGRRYSAHRLIEKATGSPPDHRPLVQSLTRKYTELYGL